LVEACTHRSAFQTDDTTLFKRQPIDEAEDYDDDGWDVSGANDDEEASHGESAVVRLPASFKSEIDRLIRDEFDGVCFVKLNWSSPRVCVILRHRAPSVVVGCGLDDKRTEMSQRRGDISCAQVV
jgi:hypothetical protein